MAYSIQEIREITQAVALQPIRENEIVRLAFDSRNIIGSAETLFFAIKGKNHDGHRHMAECIEKGIRNFIIEDRAAYDALPAGLKENINTLLVPDSIHAMQELAAFHRAQFDIPVIGITGSNGKTVVKEWLYELLKPEHQVLRSPKSYNSQIGAPLSVWQLHAGHELAIFEAGISQPGEMHKLEKIIRPETGIVTNIGEAHQANFSSSQQKIEEKIELFRNARLLIYCSDYIELDKLIRAKRNSGFFREDKRFLSWGTAGDAEARTRVDEKGNLHISYAGNEYALRLPFTDRASVENITHCCILLLSMGYTADVLQERILRLHSVEMRLEIKEGINGCTLINDTYNSDLLSFSIALDTLGQQSQHEAKTVILSDIFESGKEEGRLYEEVARLLRQKKIGKFIGIGQALQRNISKFPEGSIFYNSTSDLLREYDLNSFEDEAILIKGSRIFGFEKIAEKLQQKVHTTVLRINLNAVVHNLNVYRGLLKPTTKIMAMVKAFSYGSGSYEIANILQFHKVDYLAVAYADESISLRRHGIQIPILVMNTEASAFDNMIKYRLEPEIYSFRTLRQFVDVLEKHELEDPYPIHIKIDTGMHRLGFMPADLDALAAQLADIKNIKVRSVFSHLSSADEPALDAYTKEQIMAFEKLSKKIETALGHPVLKHILNSPGIARFPKAQFDMVRLGLGLYGHDPSETIQDKLEEVSTLVTHISQIKTVHPGEAVGYSRKGKITQETKIAITGIGYADGFPRALGNGVGEMLVKGRRAAVVGNVCMDMTMIDITGIEVEEGDEAIVFGKELPIDEMAAKLKTIPYEILTNVSQRVKRVYYKE